MNLLTILGQSLLLLIVFFPAVVLEVFDYIDGIQPILPKSPSFKIISVGLCFLLSFQDWHAVASWIWC